MDPLKNFGTISTHALTFPLQSTRLQSLPKSSTLPIALFRSPIPAMSATAHYIDECTRCHTEHPITPPGHMTRCTCNSTSFCRSKVSLDHWTTLVDNDRAPHKTTASDTHRPTAVSRNGTVSGLIRDR